MNFTGGCTLSDATGHIVDLRGHSFARHTYAGYLQHHLPLLPLPCTTLQISHGTA